MPRCFARRAAQITIQSSLSRERARPPRYSLPIILRNNYRLTGPCNFAGERNKVGRGTGQRSLFLVVDCSVPVVCFASVAPVRLVNDRDPARVLSPCSVIASWPVRSSRLSRFSVCHRVPRRNETKTPFVKAWYSCASLFIGHLSCQATARLFSSLYQLPRPLSLRRCCLMDTMSARFRGRAINSRGFFGVTDRSSWPPVLFTNHVSSSCREKRTKRLADSMRFFQGTGSFVRCVCNYTFIQRAARSNQIACSSVIYSLQHPCSFLGFRRS